MASFVAGASQNLESLQEQLSRRAPNDSYQDGSAENDGIRQNSPPPPPSEHGDEYENDNNFNHHPQERGFGGSFRRRHTDKKDLGRTLTSYDLSKDDKFARDKEDKNRKMGTFRGVFMPVYLNDHWINHGYTRIGIIMYLRFGFILGQTGLLGSLLLLFLGYLIDIFTATSISAIATNGQVRGGGPYYMLSRSLGPEFGGSIGICFCLGQALNTTMNVLGFVESLLDIFGQQRETTVGVLPDTPWWLFLYGTILLGICAIINLVGSKVFNKATIVVAVVVFVSVVSIPVSYIFKAPFVDPIRHVKYTGPSLQTLSNNLFPRFTKHAAGSSTSKRDSYRTVFGVLFPALNGILSGASLSGSLRKPGKSITKGTFWALFSTGVVYVVVLFMMASSTDRSTFYNDLGVLQDISIAPYLISIGTLASCFFSAMLGVNACSQILQAIARDNLIPILRVFGQGTKNSDNPTYGILFTWIIAQLVMFADNVNIIASLVTMFTMLVFSTINLACFVLRAAASQNFRPSFRWFSEWTALAGLILCILGMIVTDPPGASAAVIISIFLFLIIHYTSPPKSWGDVTQSLIYHQVRKYLLRLDERKNNVKFWRPAILLLTDDIRKDMNMILSMNSLKKGGLYILGHVMKGNFDELLPSLRRQQLAWLKFVDIAHIKAFVDMTVAENERVGARSLMMNSGLGSMRPNIVVIGYLDAIDWRNHASLDDENRMRHAEQEIRSQKIHKVDINPLPTDNDRVETPIKVQDYVGILEDTLALNKALAIAYRFQDLELPARGRGNTVPNTIDEQTKYIDLWPLLSGEDGWSTYTMVLQLGTTLSYVPSWGGHKLRVTIFVENPEEVQEERRKMELLLSNLRIPASLRIVVLASGFLNTYEILVRGRDGSDERIDMALNADPWWDNIRRHREQKNRSASPSPSASRHGTGSAKTFMKSLQETGPSWIQRHDLGNVMKALSKSAVRGKVRSTSISYHPEAPTPDTSDTEHEEEVPDATPKDDSATTSLFRTFTEPFRSRSRLRTQSMSVHERSSSRDPDRDPLISPVQQRRRRTSYGGTRDSAITPITEEEPEVQGQKSVPKVRVVSDDPVVIDSSGSSSSTLSGAAPSGRIENDNDNDNDKSTFNQLPYRAQMVILNELFCQHSNPQTSLIITSLPAPESGASSSFEKSSAYLEHLGSFFHNLPPVLAVYSSQQTMTTAL